jgi:glycosyltransferase involved in cell wall biosynthesis
VTRLISQRQLTGIPLAQEEADLLLKKEVELAGGADCVVAVSARDAERFRKHGTENVKVVGHALDPVPTPSGFDEREGFLFVGAIHEEASPNGDSVIWFLEEILPMIRKALGDSVSFTVAGVNRSERVRQLAGPAVRLTGHLPDLTHLYDSARVFVAPTRYAAGIPHKVHEAAARGIPIVATPLLAVQLGWENEDPFLVGGEAQSFAEQCVQLYRNRHLWLRLREAALARIRDECSTSVFEAGVVDCLTSFGVRLNVGMDR